MIPTPSNRPFSDSRQRATAGRLLPFLVVTLLVSSFAATPGALADDTDNVLERRTVVKALAYLDAREVPGLLSMLQVGVTVDHDHQSVILRGRDDLDTALRLLDALDTPPVSTPNLELVVYILGASRSGSAGDLPGHLQPVAEQLGQVLGYSSFRLADSTFLRIRDRSEGAVSGALTDSDGKTWEYRLDFSRARVLGYDRSPDKSDQPLKLRFDNLRFFYGEGDAKLQTDIELREGQKAVVGKATSIKSEETLILVLDSRILDEG